MNDRIQSIGELLNLLQKQPVQEQRKNFARPEKVASFEKHERPAPAPVPAQNNEGKRQSKIKSWLETSRPYTEKLDNSNNIFMRWLPSFWSVLGLFTIWYLNIWLGITFGLCGAASGYCSKNKLNKIISVTVGVATIVVGILALIVLA